MIKHETAAVVCLAVVCVVAMITSVYDCEANDSIDNLECYKLVPYLQTDGLIKKGWIPQGGPVSTSHGLFQAVVNSKCIKGDGDE